MIRAVPLPGVPGEKKAPAHVTCKRSPGGSFNSTSLDLGILPTQLFMLFLQDLPKKETSGYGPPIQTARGLSEMVHMTDGLEGSSSA